MTAPHRATVAELVPLLRRAAALDPAALVRLRWSPERVSALVWLPFDVLAGRTLLAQDAGSGDLTCRAGEVLAWVDAPSEAPFPQPRDAQWRWPVPPPVVRWTRLETVPDTELRPLVRQGALTLQQVAHREGLADSPGAQPRAQVADTLLDTVVLQVSDGRQRVEVTLRHISALLRMGFVARGSSVAIDVGGRWLRVVGTYGSIFAERAGLGLGVRAR